MECWPIAGRDRVLAIRCDRNRGRVLIADENTPLGGGRSSRRAGTRALPESHPRSGLETSITAPANQLPLPCRRFRWPHKACLRPAQLRPDRMFADCDRLAKDFPRID